MIGHSERKRTKPKSQAKLALREDRDRPSQRRGRCKGWRSNWLMRKTGRERRSRHVGGGLYQRGAALSGDPGSDLTALSSDSAWTRRFPGDTPSASALTTVQRQKTSRQTCRLMNIDLYAHTPPRPRQGDGGDYNQRKSFALSFSWELAYKNGLEGWWILLKMSMLASDIYIERDFYIPLDEVREKGAARGRGKDDMLQRFSGLNQNWALKVNEDPSWGARSPGLF